MMLRVLGERERCTNKAIVVLPGFQLLHVDDLSLLLALLRDSKSFIISTITLY